MNFNDCFKKLRLAKGLSQSELARALNISRSAVCMYEQGKRKPPINQMEAFADYFNVSLSYILGKEDKIMNRALSLALCLEKMTNDEVNRFDDMCKLMFPDIFKEEGE